MLPLSYRLKTNLFPDYVKLIGYLASAVNVVSSNSYVGPSLRIKMSLFWLWIMHRWTHQLQDNDIFSKASTVNKSSEWESHAIATIFVFI